MKYLITLILASSVAVAQTTKERAKITATYDQKAIAELTLKIQAESTLNDAKISEYIRNYKFAANSKQLPNRFIGEIPIFFTNNNAGSATMMGATEVYPGGSLGLSVSGVGMTAGVWDGSGVRDQHNELAGKVTLSDGATGYASHATHVTGTIIASGISTTRRGIAYGANAKTYDWNSDISEMNAFGQGGYLVSNHSYGYNTDTLPMWIFGNYDGGATSIDNVANAYPFYQIVVAAGNDRNNSNLEQISYKEGYDMLTGYGVSKNALTVAAVNQVLNYSGPASVVMSDFSNYGPTDDGRIKPDISAKGVNVNSCGNLTNAQYSISSGTSMAAPAVTGGVLLLQNHYNNLNNAFMRASTVRGLICHSAKEAGANVGPDYEFGWGLIDVANAATIISGKNTNSVVEENTLSSNGTFTKTFAISTPQTIMATICWTDPTGAQNGNGQEDIRTARLRNNLDIKIIKDGVEFFPWKLDVENPTAAATRDSDNNVDNIEKVQIDNAQPGVYTIQVTHKGSLTGGSQVFSLIASGSTGITLGVASSDFSNNIVLYPNPTKSILNFSTPNDEAIEKVSFVDMLGKEFQLNSTVVNNSVSVESLSKGVYFVKFQYQGQVIVKKFIKE